MKKGFTLVEVLVAIGLFSILVAIAAGGFVTALRSQREVAGFIAAQSNAGLALEQIARELRTGYAFCDVVPNSSPTPSPACQPNCTLNGNFWTCSMLNFYNADSANVTYSLADGSLERSASDENGGQTEAITGGNVVVKYLTFTLFGNTEDDQWNPRITISMGVGASSTDPNLAASTVTLQTTVSARGIDCNTTGC